jgi:hypothetical protein
VRFLFVLLLISCGNSKDSGLESLPNTPETRLHRMNQVMISHCIRCHDGVNQSPNLSWQTTEDWLSLSPDYFVLGNPEQSYLYQKLKGNENLGGAANMPLGSSALSEQERNYIYEFILNVQ